MHSQAQRDRLANRIRETRKGHDKRIRQLPPGNAWLERKGINEAIRVIFLSNKPSKPSVEQMLAESEELMAEYHRRLKNKADLCPQVCGEDDAWWEATWSLRSEAQSLRQRATLILRS